MASKEDLQAILDQAKPNDASGWVSLVDKISAALKKPPMKTLNQSQKAHLDNLKQYGINIDATNFRTIDGQPMQSNKYDEAFEACKAAIRDIFSAELGQVPSSGQPQQAAANPTPAASKSSAQKPQPQSSGQPQQAVANPTVPPKPGGGKELQKAPLPKAPVVVSSSYSNINNLPQTAPQNIDDWNNILFSEQILKYIDKKKFAETIRQKWSEYVDITTTTRTETDYNDDGEYLYQVIDYKIQIKENNWESMKATKTTMGTAYTTNQIVYDAFRNCKHRH